MGACGVAAFVALLLASALLSSAASSRVLEGEAGSGKGAPAPTVATGGSQKTDRLKGSGQSSAAGQQAESKSQQDAPPPTTTAKDSKQPTKPTGAGEKKGQEGDGDKTQTTTTSPPPPLLPVREKNVQKDSPPPLPEGSGPKGGDEAKGSTGNKGKDDSTEKLKEVMEKCDASHKCSVGEDFFACLHVSDNAAIGSFVVVLNKGQNVITVNVKGASSDNMPTHLPKGVYRQLRIRKIDSDGKITLNGGNGDCILQVGQSVSDLQQQFQKFVEHATRLNPIYGAYFAGFTVILVGVVCLCCKFTRKRRSTGVPYQQLEMNAPAPNSSGADNTTSMADGWDQGWDDDWDDEEAPARPSDKKPASSVSANGLSLRPGTDNKDGWDVDWDE